MCVSCRCERGHGEDIGVVFTECNQQVWSALQSTQGVAVKHHMLSSILEQSIH